MPNNQQLADQFTLLRRSNLPAALGVIFFANMR